MSKVYVADTMAIVLYLEKRKLPLNVKTLFNEAISNNITICISSVSLMEIGYLSERLRIDTSIDDVISFAKSNPSFLIVSLDPQTIKTAFTINDIPELHDRLIAASAVGMDATLITNDPIIQQSKSVDSTW